MPVITIARQLGSLGDEVGRALADRLNLRYLDHRVLLDYVREFGEIEPDAPEIAETQPSFWERLNEERRRHAIVVRCGVYGFAADNDAVIVGLGGNFLLRGMAHALRVSMVAPSDVRVERVMEKGVQVRPGPLSREQATDVVRRSDRERGGYIRYMHNADWNDVHGYDLVLNTGFLDIDSATDFLSFAVERAEVTPTAQSLAMAADLALGARVEAVLISHAGIWVHGLKATADRGVVTIGGEVITDEDREYAEDTARAVPGVRAIINELRIQPPPLTGM
ncbi:MAG: cytidylate kinase family protein [Chloroflexota bacterium]